MDKTREIRYPKMWTVVRTSSTNHAVVVAEILSKDHAFYLAGLLQDEHSDWTYTVVATDKED